MNYLDKLAKPAATDVNIGLRVPTAAELTSLLGAPRQDYTGVCQPVSNPTLKKRIKTKRFGTFNATGFELALDSLSGILDRVDTEIPDLRKIIGTAGMLCARKVKLPGGRLGNRPSAHSWGTAIDITLDGKLDQQGDNKFFRGLFILSRYFNAAQWYWGVQFPFEDAMHFEVSFQLLSQWKKDGLV